MKKDVRRMTAHVVDFNVDASSFQLTFKDGNKTFIVDCDQPAWIVYRLTHAIGEYRRQMKRRLDDSEKSLRAAIEFMPP